MCVVVAGVSRAGAAEPATAAPRLVIGDEPAGAALRALDAAGPVAIPVAVRIADADFPKESGLDARLAALAKRRVPVWLSVRAPEAEADVERWQMALRGLLEKHGPALFVLEVAVDAQPPRVASYAMQVAATEVRATHDAIRLAIGGPAMDEASRRETISRAELPPYVDLLAIGDAGREPVAPWLHEIDPNAAIAAIGSGSSVVDGILHDLGTDVALHVWPASEVTPPALGALGAVRDLLSDDVSLLDDAGVGLALRVGAADVTTTLPHRLLFDERTFSTYLVYWGEAAADPLLMTLIRRSKACA